MHQINIDIKTTKNLCKVKLCAINLLFFLNDNDFWNNSLNIKKLSTLYDYVIKNMLKIESEIDKLRYVIHIWQLENIILQNYEAWSLITNKQKKKNTLNID